MATEQTRRLHIQGRFPSRGEAWTRPMRGSRLANDVGADSNSVGSILAASNAGAWGVCLSAGISCGAGFVPRRRVRQYSCSSKRTNAALIDGELRDCLSVL